MATPGPPVSKSWSNKVSVNAPGMSTQRTLMCYVAVTLMTLVEWLSSNIRQQPQPAAAAVYCSTAIRPPQQSHIRRISPDSE